MEGQAPQQTLGEMLLERFALKNPLAAGLRLVFERLFERGELNALFESNRDQQYTRNILFVTLVEVMLAVVTRKASSVHAALQKRKGSIGGSFTAFYNKLNGTGIGPSEALVRHAFERGRGLLKEMGGLRAKPLPGWLQSEIAPLGYPRAALLGFRVAVMAYNAVSTLLGAMRATRGEQVVCEQVSGYYIAEYGRDAVGAVDDMTEPEDWRPWQQMSLVAAAALLKAIASRIDLRAGEEAQARAQEARAEENTLPERASRLDQETARWDRRGETDEIPVEGTLNGLVSSRSRARSSTESPTPKCRDSPERHRRTICDQKRPFREGTVAGLRITHPSQ